MILSSGPTAKAVEYGAKGATNMAPHATSASPRRISSRLLRAEREAT